MSKDRPRFVLADVMLLTIFAALLVGLVRWGSRGLGGPNATTNFILYEVGFVAWFIAWGWHRSWRRAKVCADCGRRFAPKKKDGSETLCPVCLSRLEAPDAKRAEKKKNRRTLVILSLALCGVAAVLLYGPMRRIAGPYLPIALPVAAVGAVLAFVSMLFGVIYAVMWARILIRRSDGVALSQAQKHAGTEGTTATLGPHLVWSSGPDDPLPLLTEARTTSLSRLSEILGRPIEAKRRVKVLVFSDRRAFVGYQRPLGVALWSLDGFYHNLLRTMTLTTDSSPYRLVDVPGTARSLFTYLHFEEWKGFLPKPWVQQGLAWLVTGRNLAEPESLRRRMVAAIERGSVRGVELFEMTSKDAFKLARDWADLDAHAAFSDTGGQAQSIVAYLAGPDAPADRRERFAGFLDDLRKSGRSGPVFERHFGFGYDRLLEDWRADLLAREPAPHRAPADEVRDGLVGRILTLIRDPKAATMDRVLAVRELGRLGYLLGGDLLIADLRSADSDIPRAELIRSLESISGHAWGDDPDRWASFLVGRGEPQGDGSRLSAERNVPAEVWSHTPLNARGA